MLLLESDLICPFPESSISALWITCVKQSSMCYNLRTQSAQSFCLLNLIKVAHLSLLCIVTELRGNSVCTSCADGNEAGCDKKLTAR